VPALPAVAHVIRIDYDFAYASNPHARCREFWFYTGTGATSTELATLAGSIGTQWGAIMKDHFNAEVTLETITITDLSSSTSPVGVGAIGIAGTRAGGAQPADVAVLESLHVARRYRGGHPRIYWPAFDNSDVLDALHWLAASVTEFTADLAEWRAAWDALIPADLGTIVPVAISYYQGFTVHTGTTGRARNVSTVRATPILDNVNSRTVQQGIATQRRRLLRIA
jgi:hypothetical protein